MAVEIEGIDELIVEQIRVIRARHHACTARALALTCGYHHTYISQRLGLLRERGIVTFTDMPGSIDVALLSEMTPAQARMANVRAAKAAKKAAAQPLG